MMMLWCSCILRNQLFFKKMVCDPTFKLLPQKAKVMGVFYRLK